jgi:hypothetical protein
VTTSQDLWRVTETPFWEVHGTYSKITKYQLRPHSNGTKKNGFKFEHRYDIQSKFNSGIDVVVCDWAAGISSHHP